MVLQSLPWLWLGQSSNLLNLSLEYTRFSTGIELAQLNSRGDKQRLINIHHTHLSLDYHSVYIRNIADLNIGLSAGLGISLPLSAAVLSPSGEVTFAQASGIYPDAQGSLSDIDKRFALNLLLGFNQKALEDAVWWGGGFKIAFLQRPRTRQVLYIHLYVAVALW